MELAPVAFDGSHWTAIERPDGAIAAPEELLLVTFNTWFADYEFERRSTALLSLLERISADVVVLQEVTRPLLDRILAENWIRANYQLSDATGESLGSYGVVALSRVPLQSIELHQLTSKMGRELLVVQLAGGFRVATVHLESLAWQSDTRQTQLAEIFALLEGFDHAAVLGDFNLCHTSPENDNIDPRYLDLWPALRPDEPGWTEDTSVNLMRLAAKGRHKSVRFDRILLRSRGNYWQPQSIERLGTTPLSPDTPEVFISDHFGLAGTITCRR